MSAHTNVAAVDPGSESYRLRLQIGALEQLLDVYETAVIEQCDHLEKAGAALTARVEELNRSNAELQRLHDRVVHESDERRQAQQNLLRSQRLASIGTLAAGLAHEINNPLGLIALEVHRAGRHARDPDEVSAALAAVSGYVKRCAQIVKSVLRFARDEPNEVWPEDLNRVAEHARDLTREAARKAAVDVDLQLSQTLPDIVMNPTEMEQVFVNLLLNAIHASDAGDHIVFRTGFTGRRAHILVRDRGCGMTSEDRERAFDPFYTTRSAEGGTGLGLSTCRIIVEQLGGSIRIESECRKGTDIIVELPWSAQP